MPFTTPQATKTNSPDANDIFIAAIYAALNYNGHLGWENWSAYAASGEWA